MGVKNASSVLNHLLHNILKNPNPTNSESATKQILSLLKSNNLSKAVSLLFNSPFAFPFPLYTHLLTICASSRAIVEARKLESHLVSFNPTPPVFILNRVIETYSNCGCLADARELFDEMPERDGGSWNAMIMAFSRGGYPEKALNLFREMNSVGVLPNEVTLAGTLSCCAAVLELVLSREIHGMIFKYGFLGNVILESSLVDVYGKCWVMSDARRMFNEMCSPNAISWNVIVRRYLDACQEREAIFMFFGMMRCGNVKPLGFTVSNALVACSRVSTLKEGMQTHVVAIKFNFLEAEVVLNSLVDMYVKCTDLESARRLFDQKGSKNLINWTTMVSGYAKNGEIQKARGLFDEMPERNVISWNAMLTGYTSFFEWEEGLNFFLLMQKLYKSFDHVTLGLILNVCAGLSDVELGKQAHGCAYRHGFCSNLLVSNALLHMYGTCGNIKSVKVLFYQMSHLRDKVSWNAMLSCYARHRMSEEAMTMFPRMQGETAPSKYTFATLLAACANIFALSQGKEIHGFMIRNGYDIDVVLRGALVDMYSKCRCIDYSVKVLKEAPPQDLVLWNSMILGCYYNKKSGYVFELLQLMEREGVAPDHVTFRGVLLACIDEGRVELGREYFDSMGSKYCVIPRVEHYECVIELYGRYGFIEELGDFVKKMPFEPTEGMLTRVFDACREHRHLNLGEWAASRLNEMNSQVPFRFELLDRN